jgi:hypothetical protein
MKVGMPLNNIPYYTRPFFTADYVRRGDHIEHSVIGEVNLVAVTPVTWLDQFVYYACQTEEILVPTDRAASSGTWHTDSEAVKTDPRNRIKAWIDAHISYGVCDYQTMFAGIDYPHELEFIDNGLEITSFIDVQQGAAEYTHDHYPYKFNETVTITNTAKDTATLTATNILESFEQAIRDVATDYPLGSIRRIRSSQPDRLNIGGMWLWQNTMTIEYTRWNDDYTPSYPRITWGPSASPTGTFTFPNVTNLRYPSDEEVDIWLHPPNYTTSIVQPMGDPPLNIEITCDLDFEPAALTWKRPQATTPKTDSVNHEVFWENKHEEGIDEPYHTLTLSATGPSLKVRMLRKPVVDDNVLSLLFREYTTATASSQSVQTRYALT